MDFGINLATSSDSWKVVRRAEELGYARAWFYDTQMLNADLFVAMGAAAVQTSRIRLATGVLIPSNRIAPVAASALASLNPLAPGRIDFGISTGFTARRTMGLGPVKLGDMEEYIRIVQRLLAGETLEWTFEGQRRKIRFLSPDLDVVNLRDPIPLHISAMGPKGRALTARLRASWINATGNMNAARDSVAEMQKAWRAAGVDPAACVATAFVGGCVLREGEAYDSARARAQVGPHATVALHNQVEVEQFGNMGRSGASAAGAPGRALPADLREVRAGRRALPLEPSRPPDVPATGGARGVHRRPDPHDDLHGPPRPSCASASASYARPATTTSPSHPSRPSRDAGGMGRRLRGSLR